MELLTTNTGAKLITQIAKKKRENITWMTNL